MELRFFPEFSIARPPNARERAILHSRLARLSAMEDSAAAATARLQALHERRSTQLESLRLRHGYVRRESADLAVDTSDRSAPDRKFRPPSTRLMSPRGRAQSFFLTALFEAQTRLEPGQAATASQLPIVAENTCTGWTDYVATDAKAATDGRIFASVPAKKGRQIESALHRLASENLVSLTASSFVLMREDARPTGDNDVYRVPEHEGSFFTVPLQLFTNGWIHVLEDSELILLLIAARMRFQHGDEAQPLRSGPRKLNYGLSRDSFEAAHRMLDYLGILTVISDYQRSSDGKVDDFAKRGAKPHLLRLNPEALDTPAYPTITDTIATQIRRSEDTTN